MIQMYNRNDQRFFGFSFVELVDGLSKLMVRGRTHTFIDQNLVNMLLNILDHSTHDDALLECVSNAILNAAFDERVQSFLDSDRALQVIRTAQNTCRSQLVQKNCEAILWTLNRIPHKCSATLSDACQLQGHIMISYNRSVTAMCLKIRDRLKVNLESHSRSSGSASRLASRCTTTSGWTWIISTAECSSPWRRRWRTPRWYSSV